MGIIGPHSTPHSGKKGAPCNTPGSIVKKYKCSMGRGTVLEGWLEGPCKIHATPDNIPTHSLRACWILWQVAKSGVDILTKNNPKQHPQKTMTPKY